MIKGRLLLLGLFVLLVVVTVVTGPMLAASADPGWPSSTSGPVAIPTRDQQLSSVIPCQRFGVNLNGGEFSAPNRPNYPGVYGTDYIYPGADHCPNQYDCDNLSWELDYYLSKGQTLIRFPVKWERLQHQLYGPLYTFDLQLIDQMLASANARGMKVIIDSHDAARRTIDGTTTGTEYLIGSPQVPYSAFTDYWDKMALHFRGNPAVFGYAITSEPHDMNGLWLNAGAQAGVDGVRLSDSQTAIMVPGDVWSSAHLWLQNGNDSLRNLIDPENNLIFDAHQYFDYGEGGGYDLSYDYLPAYPNIGVDYTRPFVNWLRQYNLKGFLGEYGVPDDDPRWFTVLDNFLGYLQQSSDVIVGGTYWAAGPWWHAYRLSVEPRGGLERAQIPTLVRHYGDCPQTISPTPATTVTAVVATPTSTYVPSITPTGISTNTNTPVATPTVCNVALDEDFEDGTLGALWGSLDSVVRVAVPTPGWSASSSSPNNGLYSAFAPDYSSVSDALLAPIKKIPIPIGGSATLSFWQKFQFESAGGINYDGGVLEVSLDGGGSWLTDTTFISGGYNGSISSGLYGNPLSGRSAWVGSSAFTHVIVNLQRYAGHSILFRFRLGTDSSNVTWVTGWFVDDISVTLGGVCWTPTPTPNVPPSTPTASSTATFTYTPVPTATPLPSSCQAADWINLINVTATGNNIEKTSGLGSTWDAGSMSSRVIQSGDGYVQATVDATNTYRMFGLSNAAPVAQNQKDVDFAAYLAGNLLMIYESGQFKGSYGSLNVGDTVRVAIEGGSIKYYLNGNYLRTSTLTPGYPLMLETAINTKYAWLTNLLICGQDLGYNGLPTFTPTRTATPTGTPTSTSTATRTITPTPIPCEDVTWTNLIYVTAIGNSLQKTGGSPNGWDAGAVSTMAIQSGDGYTQATVDSISTYRMFGLSNGETSPGHIDIDYAAYMAANTLIVFEDGQFKGAYGALNVGDTVRVAVEAGIIKYYLNGTFVHSSSTPPTYPLAVDASINTAGGRINYAVICGNSLGPSLLPTPTP